MGRAKKIAMAYWLIPAREERKLFVSLIRILARQLDAPLFEPHLTLFVGALDRESARAVLDAIDAKSISLSIRDVQFSALFTKTLFVRFQPSAELNRLIAGMQRSALVAPQKNSDPQAQIIDRKLNCRDEIRH